MADMEQQEPLLESEKTTIAPRKPSKRLNKWRIGFWLIVALTTVVLLNDSFNTKTGLMQVSDSVSFSEPIRDTRTLDSATKRAGGFKRDQITITTMDSATTSTASSTTTTTTTTTTTSTSCTTTTSASSTPKVLSTMNASLTTLEETNNTLNILPTPLSNDTALTPRNTTTPVNASITAATPATDLTSEEKSTFTSATSTNDVGSEQKVAKVKTSSGSDGTMQQNAASETTGPALQKGLGKNITTILQEKSSGSKKSIGPKSSGSLKREMGTTKVQTSSKDSEKRGT